jgi:intein/homing endonuclease
MGIFQKTQNTKKHVSNGVRDVIEIELEDGKRLTVTEDHLVMTKNRGWVNAGSLTDSDEVLIFSDCENQT